MKKMFKIMNQQPGAWSDSTHTLLGWEIDDKNLIITKLKGCDVTFDGFLALCKKEFNNLKEVCKDYKRVCPYKLVEKKINNRYKPIIKYLVSRGNFWEKGSKKFYMLRVIGNYQTKLFSFLTCSYCLMNGKTLWMKK